MKAAEEMTREKKNVQWSGYGELGNISQKPLQPTAEGAEEIIESILESLGDPESMKSILPLFFRSSTTAVIRLLMTFVF